MTTFNIQLFGITRDIVGQTELSLSLEQNSTVDTLLSKIKQQYPDLQKIKSILVAVNSEYAQLDDTLSANDEIALIPPVSGG
jgi:molybdopterin converting factor subunit 1